MKNKFFLLTFIFLLGGSAFAQQERFALIAKIHDSLSSYVSSANLGDSLALYTSAVKIQVTINKKKQTIIVTENDSIASTIFNSRHKQFLASLDFRPIAEKRKQFTIIIPVAMIIANYRQNDRSEKKINLLGLPEKLAKLFSCELKDECDNSKYTYLQPLIVVADKAVYD